MITPQNSRRAPALTTAPAAADGPPPPAGQPGAARGVIIALLLLLFLGLLDVQILSPILPGLAVSFQTTIAAMGIAVTVYAAAASACALVIGPLSDYFGRLPFLRWAALLFTLAAAGAWLAPAFPFYLAARLLAGLAGGVISAAVIAQMADSFPYESRGRAMGWIGAMYFAAAVVGVPAGALLAGSWGWRALYLVLAGAAGALTVCLFALRAIKTPRAQAATAQAEGANDWRLLPVVTGQIRAYSHYWRAPRTRQGLLLALAVSATTSLLLTYLGVWLSARFGMSTAEIGLVFLLTGLAATITALTGGWWADRFGKRRVIILSSAMLVVVLPLLAHVTTLVQLYLLCAAGGMLLAVREGPFQALSTEVVPVQERGAFLALRNFTSQLAIAASAAAGGVLYQAFGFRAICFAAAGSSALALIAAARLSLRAQSHTGWKRA
ncbi:MAG: MFS transporter [candidate division KSB1 bacterium]|nr:MFS transporter [candidate division KSB1 bacterium]MDZ7274877.1 MFS transporter [candidate division KSB1 bacterium]MDZ7286671.1 MFS transporter [candidate division KSB1 bacterium]MDZ7299166.1 MFS transporter [candidate division KSB1 bacterium]MDZ7307024.1 MFS transporter [candidate division KSB1 bacterium]